MTMAPSSAPTAGRVSSRDSSVRRPTRSSRGGGGAARTLTSTVELINNLQNCLWRGTVSTPAGPHPSLASAARGELADEIDVLAVHQEPPGQRGLATAPNVALCLITPQPSDGPETP